MLMLLSVLLLLTLKSLFDHSILQITHSLLDSDLKHSANCEGQLLVSSTVSQDLVYIVLIGRYREGSR
jgi:hypothetical protein